MIITNPEPEMIPNCGLTDRPKSAGLCSSDTQNPGVSNSRPFTTEITSHFKIPDLLLARHRCSKSLSRSVEQNFELRFLFTRVGAADLSPRDEKLSRPRREAIQLLLGSSFVLHERGGSVTSLASGVEET